LEALALWCPDIIGRNQLSVIVRATQAADLFSDQDIASPIKIAIDGHGVEIVGGKDGLTVRVIKEGQGFQGYALQNNLSLNSKTNWPAIETTVYQFSGSTVQNEDNIK